MKDQHHQVQEAAPEEASLPVPQVSLHTTEVHTTAKQEPQEEQEHQQVVEAVADKTDGSTGDVKHASLVAAEAVVPEAVLTDAVVARHTGSMRTKDAQESRGISLDLPASIKVSKSKAALFACHAAQHPHSTTTTVQNLPAEQVQEDDQMSVVTEHAHVQESAGAPRGHQHGDSRMLNWSYGVSLDLSMTPCSVPQTPVSLSVYSFPGMLPCSPRSPIPTQRLIGAMEPWSNARFSPPLPTSARKNDGALTPKASSTSCLLSLPFPPPGDTPECESHHKSAIERERERERDREKEKRCVSSMIT